MLQRVMPFPGIGDCPHFHGEKSAYVLTVARARYINTPVRPATICAPARSSFSSSFTNTRR